MLTFELECEECGNKKLLYNNQIEHDIYYMCEKCESRMKTISISADGRKKSPQ